jgi:hypothetical protein
MIAYKLFRPASKQVRFFAFKTTKIKEGTIATHLVKMTLYQVGIFKSRKPSMTNCPA